VKRTRQTLSYAIISPPLRIEVSYKVKYTIHSTYPEKEGFGIPCSLLVHRVFDSRQGEVPWGVIWVTDALLDDFLILWGLHPRQPPSLSYGYDCKKPSWWAKGHPWCSIMDKPKGEGTPFQSFFKETSQLLLSPLIPFNMAKKSWIITRPTGSHISLRIEPVDFLGRRTFNLRIDTSNQEQIED
jgi:hypothetical protein